MMWAKIDKVSLIVVNLEVASQEWVDDWTEHHPDDPCFYSIGDNDGEFMAGIGWTFDEPTRRYIPPEPDAEGTWVFNRDLWEWVQLPDTPE